MKTKWPLYIGITFLTLGLILKFSSSLKPLPLVIILTGVAFKIGYIISKIVSKEYKPGFEIGLLFLGLVLFLSGIFLHKFGHIENPSALKMIGISFKLSFIVLFIIKIRKPMIKAST